MSIIRKQPQSPHYALAIQEYSLAMKTISVDEKKKHLLSALEEIDKAITEDGELETYKSFKQTILSELNELN